ncbi:MAG: NAD-dependent epimerase/dehydratase family protein [Candidatus Hodarchaeales archaeon]|jgi:nucleoside-diphosphate-sugar epimerase
MSKTEVNVVLGGNGNIGSYVIEELLSRGKSVRLVSRSGRSIFDNSVEVVKADGFDLESLKNAFKCATKIYHCLGLPYQDFPKLEQIMKNVLSAATEEGNDIKIIYADNLYAYGERNIGNGGLTENMKHLAEGKKGKIRSNIENLLHTANAEGKIKATIGKGSDFFGPGATNSILGMYVFDVLANGKNVRLLGNLDKRHSFIYLPDFAKGLVTLGENENSFGEVWHLPHTSSLPTRKFVQMILKETKKEDKKISAMPKLMLLIGTLFNKTAREFNEVAYQWEKDFVVDDSKFRETFDITYTSTTEAITETMDFYLK